MCLGDNSNINCNIEIEWRQIDTDLDQYLNGLSLVMCVGIMSAEYKQKIIKININKGKERTRVIIIIVVWI